jgi:outer membrane receptor protein involved in Fe transport
LLLAASTLAAGAPFAPARAADADAGAAAPVQVQEVVVGARKREERLLDVPVAANVLNTKFLERYDTVDLTATGLQIPQVSIDHAASGSGSVITIRGIGAASIDAAIEQNVTVNIDGVPISRGRVIQQSTFDEASIDILKGPQSLYFGKNSPAGVIVLDSNGGTSTPSGYMRAGYEFNPADRYFIEGAFGGPIANGWSVRAALHFSEMDGGYVKGVGGPIPTADEPAFLQKLGIPETGSPYPSYPGDQDVVGRLTVSYKPVGSRFDATFKFLGSDHQDRGDSMTGVAWHCAAGKTGLSSIDFGALYDYYILGQPPTSASFPYITDPYSGCGGTRTSSYGGLPAALASGYPGSNGGVPYTDVPSWLSSLTLNYRLTDDLTLTSATGFYEYDEKQYSNYDGTDMEMASGVNNDYQQSLDEELRLQSSFKGPLNFTLGGFYGHDRRSFHQVGFVGFFGPDPANGKTDDFESIDYYTTDTLSAFGELNWKITPTVELAGGARYTSEHKTGNDGMTYVNPLLLAVAPTISAPQGERFINSFTNENVSPQVTLSWHAAPNVMLYGAYKTGFQSGGFSTPALIPSAATPQNQTFKPEKAYGGEIGAKFSILDRKLTGDVSLYDYVFADLQLTAFDIATTSYFVQNAASATTRGVEVNLAYQATRDFSVHTDIGFNRARFENFPGAQCYAGEPQASFTQGYTDASGAYHCVTQNLAGLPLNRAPNWVGLAGASYDHDLFGDYRLGLTADVRYSSGYWAASPLEPGSWQGEYATLDMSVRVYNAKWDLALIGKNLTDTYYAVFAGDKALGLPGDMTASLGLPRQVILQLTYHY